jgi:excisionase family DNA binding protein
MRQYGAVHEETAQRRAAKPRGAAVAIAEDAESVPEMVYLNTLLKLPEAAKETGTSLKTLQRAYVHGQLRALPFGARGVRIRRRDLLAWEAAGMPTHRRPETRR